MSPKEASELAAKHITLPRGADQPSHIDKVVSDWVNDKISEEAFTREVQNESERRYKQILGLTNGTNTNGKSHHE